MTDMKAQIGSCNGREGGKTKMEMSAQEGEWELPMVDSQVLGQAPLYLASCHPLPRREIVPV